MQIDAALVREQNVEFAVVVVRHGIIDNTFEANRAQTSFAPAFGFVPVVLMEQDHRGVPRYYGRPDIVDFLASIDFRRLPWAKWSLN
ncbi:MAG: hypothetical protein ABSF26_05830 [Thermoguttaceae bacterium]|jgi:hypothetical protein